MVIGAIIALSLSGIYFLWSLIKKRGGKRFSLFIIIICVGILLINSNLGGGDSQTLTAQPYQEIAPPKQYAPRIVQTYSRLYYVATMVDKSGAPIKDGIYKSGTLTLTSYYSYDKEWEYSDKELPLDTGLYGPFLIYTRR